MARVYPTLAVRRLTAMEGKDKLPADAKGGPPTAFRGKMTSLT